MHICLNISHLKLNYDFQLNSLKQLTVDEGHDSPLIDQLIKLENLDSIKVIFSIHLKYSLTNI